jgi:hypothetical protein
MSEEIQDATTKTFWDRVEWDNVGFNKISKEDYLRIRSLHPKLYATFLGPDKKTQFFLFKPLGWGKYKDIRAKDLDKDTTREYIVSSCILWPKMDPIVISNMDAGVMLALANQILAVSNFIKDPDQVLEFIFECEN